MSTVPPRWWTGVGGPRLRAAYKTGTCGWPRPHYHRVFGSLTCVNFMSLGCVGGHILSTLTAMHVLLAIGVWVAIPGQKCLCRWDVWVATSAVR